MKKIRPYIISVLIAIGVGALSAFITRDYMNIYQIIQSPPLAPPSVVFPVVWTILYALMGIGSAIIYTECGGTYECSGALRVYALQLAVNFFWSIIFFRWRMYFFAFLWLLLLIALVAVMIIRFWRIKPVAGYLQIPYIAWLIFAAYLNFAIFILN